MGAQSPPGKAPEPAYKMTAYQLLVLKPGPDAAKLLPCRQCRSRRRELNRSAVS